jgi:hypothetical protein
MMWRTVHFSILTLTFLSLSASWAAGSQFGRVLVDGDAPASRPSNKGFGGCLEMYAVKLKVDANRVISVVSEVLVCVLQPLSCKRKRS